MYLTLEDPRAQIKGSRDPLGVQAIWTRFGRHVVGNLTTVTSSLRSFTVLLLGRYFAQRLVEEERVGEEDALSVFLRWEQVAGYIRQRAHDAGGDVRGIERIRRHLDEHGTTVPIGVSAEAFILSDQKTYGLWGLYTVAARVSGLLPGGSVGVTVPARQFLEEVALPHVKGAEGELLRLVEKGGKLSVAKNSSLMRAVAPVLTPELSQADVDFYAHWLRDGAGIAGPVASRQARVAELMTAHLDLDQPIGRESLLMLAETARGVDEGLAERLSRIVSLEALLAPAEALFDHVLARPNMPVQRLARDIKEHWGRRVPNLDPDAFARIVPEIEGIVGTPITTLVSQVFEALRAGAYSEAFHRLADWNRHVMDARHGAPWVRIEQGRLDVLYRGPEWLLPTRAELHALWRNSYFLDSLRLITRELRGGKA